MTDQEDDIKFEKLLADKRHKELKTALNNIAVSMSNKGNGDIVKAIESQGEAIGQFAEAVKQLPAPQVSINGNNELVVSSIEQMAKGIIKGQNDLVILINKMIEENKKPKEWEHKVSRSYGTIDKVISKQINK